MFGYYTLVWEGDNTQTLDLDLEERNITQIVFAFNETNNLVTIMVGVVRGCGLMLATPLVECV